jgi:hypothetical protein
LHHKNKVLVVLAHPNKHLMEVQLLPLTKAELEAIVLSE